MAQGAAGKRKTPEKPSGVAAWKKASAGELVELPSGKRALLRRPRAFAMIAKDEIPNPMLAFVMDAAGLGEGLKEGEEDKRSDQDYATYMLWIVSRAFVEPRFHYPDPAKPDEKPPADWLTVEDVDDSDLMFVFSWSQQIDMSALEAALGDLSPFPDLSAGADDGGDGEGVRPAAEQPA
jgi:hypothetical protein